MTDDRYASPLGTRYASAEMQRLWGTRHRIGMWRRLWLALAEAQQELGIEVPDAALDEMRAHLDDVDLEAAAEYEGRFRHDVMAHIHAFGDQTPAARGHIHLGATSAFVTDNADLLVMRDGLRLLLGRLLTVMQTLERFAHTHRALPCLAYTHFQPAQLTTVGKRATLWLQDFALDAEEVCYRLEHVRLRGCKGTTGTQASFLELFDGDHQRVRELDTRLAVKMGAVGTFAVTGQTYPRKYDATIVNALGGIAMSAAKFANDLRLLQHEGELLEPFETEQIGSSAMAYKRNPMRAERINALARHVLALQSDPAHTAATQWLERTLDDSANRRMSLPETFLATDAILVLVANVVEGLEVREPVIARHVAAQMPFMATERWLMAGVSAGGDRQTLHEVIRRHALAVADDVSRGEPNDLVERLAADPAFATVPVETLRAELDPERYIGRSVQQTENFIVEFLRPHLTRARALAQEAPAAEVTV